MAMRGGEDRTPETDSGTPLPVQRPLLPSLPVDMNRWWSTLPRRYMRGMLAALLTSWTGVYIALWGGVIGMLIAVATAAGALYTLSSIGAVGATPAAAIGLLAAIPIGFLGGAGAVLGLLFFASPLGFLAGLVTATVLAFVIAAVWIFYDHPLLRLRGYRRLSREEWAALQPIAEEAQHLMGLGALPRFAMWDTAKMEAFATTRTVVLTTGMLQLPPEQLLAILIHELTHWDSGDVVANIIIQAAGWPVVLTYNLGTALGQTGSNVIRFIGWLLFWPSWVIVRAIVAPLHGMDRRAAEYRADARARELGFGPALADALRTIVEWEEGLTGWDKILAAKHPPTALRIEALHTTDEQTAEPAPEPFGPVPRHLVLGATTLLVLAAVGGVAAYVGAFAVVGFRPHPTGAAISNPISRIATRGTPTPAAAPAATSVATPPPVSTNPVPTPPSNLSAGLGVPMWNLFLAQPHTPAGAVIAAGAFTYFAHNGPNLKSDEATTFLSATANRQGANGALDLIQQPLPSGAVGLDQIRPIGVRTDTPQSGEEQRVSIYSRTAYHNAQNQDVVRWSSDTVGLTWTGAAWAVTSYTSTNGPQPSDPTATNPSLPAGFSAAPPEMP